MIFKIFSPKKLGKNGIFLLELPTASFIAKN
jgi:hypothetical protein